MDIDQKKVFQTFQDNLLGTKALSDTVLTTLLIEYGVS